MSRVSSSLVSRVSAQVTKNSLPFHSISGAACSAVALVGTASETGYSRLTLLRTVVTTSSTSMPARSASAVASLGSPSGIEPC